MSMDENAMVLNIKGIKCDNQSCNYEDMDVDFDADKFLNEPCPKCGESLLTQEDYDTVNQISELTDFLNTAFAGVDFGELDQTAVMDISLNGSGKAVFSMPKLTNPISINGLEDES